MTSWRVTTSNESSLNVSHQLLHCRHEQTTLNWFTFLTETSVKSVKTLSLFFTWITHSSSPWFHIGACDSCDMFWVFDHFQKVLTCKHSSRWVMFTSLWSRLWHTSTIILTERIDCAAPCWLLRAKLTTKAGGCQVGRWCCSVGSATDTRAEHLMNTFIYKIKTLTRTTTGSVSWWTCTVFFVVFFADKHCHTNEYSMHYVQHRVTTTGRQRWANLFIISIRKSINMNIYKKSNTDKCIWRTASFIRLPFRNKKETWTKQDPESLCVSLPRDPASYWSAYTSCRKDESAGTLGGGGWGGGGVGITSFSSPSHTHYCDFRPLSFAVSFPLNKYHPVPPWLPGRTSESQRVQHEALPLTADRPE